MEKPLDCLVVGFGLAGTAFSRILEQNNRSFLVINDSCSSNASRVSGGIINPVVLRSLNPVWKAQEFVSEFFTFFNDLEIDLGHRFITLRPILKKLSSPGEQNEWISKSDHTLLSKFLNPEINQHKINTMDSPFGFGQTKNTAQLDVVSYLDKSRDHLIAKKYFLSEKFNHQKLKKENNFFSYRSITAKRIVFCEGIGIKQNPWFQHLPINGLKGEYLIINTPDLNLKSIVKTGIFIIPMGNNQYKIGATYDRDDQTIPPTTKAREKLISDFSSIVSCPFKVEKQLAGFRPISRDRRPLLGESNTQPDIWVLNGLGTRGVIMAPLLAKWLYNSIFEHTDIPTEVNINRFYILHPV